METADIALAALAVFVAVVVAANYVQIRLRARRDRWLLGFDREKRRYDRRHPDPRYDPKQFRRPR